MKVAVPVYGEFVSNVFDFAHRLLLVDIENGKEADRSEIALESGLLSERALRLSELKVDVLICGAISQELAAMVLSAGIQVLPFVTGNVDDVIHAFTSGELSRPEFRMPGCRLGGRDEARCRGRKCRWRGGRISEWE